MQEGGEWESACTLLARALERTPNDERLYLRFRQAVEDLYDQLHHQQGSFSFNDLPAGPEVVGTIEAEKLTADSVTTRPSTSSRVTWRRYRSIPLGTSA